jgi:hypothetical protein
MKKALFMVMLFCSSCGHDFDNKRAIEEIKERRALEAKRDACIKQGDAWRWSWISEACLSNAAPTGNGEK